MKTPPEPEGMNTTMDVIDESSSADWAKTLDLLQMY